jgi:hypothetical protein
MKPSHQARVDAAWSRVKLTKMIRTALAPMDSDARLDLLLGLVAEEAPNDAPRAPPLGFREVPENMIDRESEAPTLEPVEAPKPSKKRTKRKASVDNDKRFLDVNRLPARVTKAVPVNVSETLRSITNNDRRYARRLRLFAAMTEEGAGIKEIMRRARFRDEGETTQQSVNNDLTHMRDSGLVSLVGRNKGSKWSRVASK